ncbi:unnamed protein product [Closterium sp. NIES-53]
MEVSLDTSGPADEGDPIADDTGASRHPQLVETPPGFPPRPSSPTPQPVAVDPDAARCAALGVEGTTAGGSAGPLVEVLGVLELEMLEVLELDVRYTELVGCLMYLMKCTQPDLAYPLSVLARFVATGRHRQAHWTVAKRVAKYLATTLGMGLVLVWTQPVRLTEHCDSSYSDDVATSRSSQGYCFSLGSDAVSWRSTQTSSVAQSSTDAEIYAGAMAAQELRWLNFLLTNLREQPSSAPTLFADNKAMILLCQEPRLESRVKHIHASIADIFTKALAACDHHRFCSQLGLVQTGPRLL